jgi:hypothetical protein
MYFLRAALNSSTTVSHKTGIQIAFDLFPIIIIASGYRFYKRKKEDKSKSLKQHFVNTFSNLLIVIKKFSNLLILDRS